MSFTITRKLERLPTYPMLCKLADQNKIRVIGNERIGSFSSSGVEGNYQLGEHGIRGTFAVHGVKGEFSLVIGTVAVTISDKPFWLPQVLLKQKVTEGLDSLCDELSKRPGV